MMINIANKNERGTANSTLLTAWDLGLGMGILLGGAASVLVILGKRKANYIYSGVVDLVFGILGSVLFFMMIFTNHDVTWMNENIIFVNPLLIAIAVFSFLAAGRAKNSEEWGKLAALCHMLLLTLIVLLAVLKVIAPKVFLQQNWNIIIPAALFYLPNAFAFKLDRTNKDK